MLSFRINDFSCVILIELLGALKLLFCDLHNLESDLWKFLHALNLYCGGFTEAIQ